MSNADGIENALDFEDRHELLVVDRVEHELRRQITRLQGIPGAMLPRQEVLVEKCGVSRRSVREALGRLEREKLIRSIRGKGTFVTLPVKTNHDVFLVTSESYHPFEQMFSRVFSVLLRKQGLNPNLIMAANPVADWEKQTSTKIGAKGGLLLGASFSPETIEKLLQKSEFPLVVIGDLSEKHHGRIVCNSVIPDNQALGYQATEYLIRQGHRRIAMVGWSMNFVWNREVCRGYREALEANGITPDPAWVVDLPSEYSGEVSPQTMRTPQAQIDAWSEGPNPPTALIHNGDSETRMHDILHMNFHGRFADDAVVPITYFELLPTSFSGIRDAVAFVVKFEDLAKRAIELLLRPQPEAPPVREIQARVYRCRRHHGVWREEK
jgi:DNA-binding transcriptional regulator YhcF (GntR family)